MVVKPIPELINLDFSNKTLLEPLLNKIKSENCTRFTEPEALVTLISKFLNTCCEPNWNKSINLLGFPSKLENCWLISSITKTSFESQLTKLDNLILSKDIFLVVLSERTSSSLTVSILLISSTRFSPNKSNVTSILSVDPILALLVEVIPVSAKFFIPLVCKILFTEVLKSLHSTGLWTEYDIFW